jgi:hypothetical protein
MAVTRQRAAVEMEGATPVGRASDIEGLLMLATGWHATAIRPNLPNVPSCGDNGPALAARYNPAP